MAHTTKCLSLVKGRRIRVTALDSCGRPIYGDCSQVTSKGFISVAFTANTTDSDEISVTNAAGDICVYEAAVTSLVGYAIEISFCEVDPELFALVTGQPVVLAADGETVVGFDIDTKIGLENSNFALELWAGSPTGDACATEGSQGSYGYLLLPFLKGGILGDFTIENGAVTFVLTGANTSEGNSWGVGPYDVMLGAGSPAAPGPMTSPVSTSTALRTMIVDVAPPEAACGCRPVLDPAAEEITAVAGTATGLSVEFETTPDAESGVWYDFGDGTWDYVDAPGSTTHVYAAAGTYTVKASTNGTWVTTTVTVTAAAAATVGTLTPATGPAAGATPVVIAGTNLTGATGVTFGGTPGTAFSVVNPTTINVTAPAHAAGAVAVVVQHPSGNVTKPAGYTYS